MVNTWYLWGKWWGPRGKQTGTNQGTLCCMASTFSMEVCLCVNFDIKKKRKILKGELAVQILSLCSPLQSLHKGFLFHHFTWNPGPPCRVGETTGLLTNCTWAMSLKLSFTHCAGVKQLRGGDPGVSRCTLMPEHTPSWLAAARRKTRWWWRWRNK